MKKKIKDTRIAEKLPDRVNIPDRYSFEAGYDFLRDEVLDTDLDINEIAEVGIVPIVKILRETPIKDWENMLEWYHRVASIIAKSDVLKWKEK